MESITINSSTIAKTADDSAGIGNGFVDNALIESIWKALDSRVDREQITQAILEAEAGYKNARVKTFIPIFIRRDVLERLSGNIER
ncbi:MAG: hypothetical protein AMJ56_14395 [Anaerolineae bacterium SG8_19]|jgi:hypothetical protein|nr:MAG: hypothetical protein AMJ56_14395 [Anaerolineae bacterium SG8_19]